VGCRWDGSSHNVSCPGEFLKENLGLTDASYDHLGLKGEERTG
jgi:hypothetical protein